MGPPLRDLPFILGHTPTPDYLFEPPGPLKNFITLRVNTRHPATRLPPVVPSAYTRKIQNLNLLDKISSSSYIYIYIYNIFMFIFIEYILLLLFQLLCRLYKGKIILYARDDGWNERTEFYWLILNGKSRRSLFLIAYYFAIINTLLETHPLLPCYHHEPGRRTLNI